MCWSKAIRASAARGSPCPPVAMIITSRRGSFIAVVEVDHLGKISEIADALRNPEDAVQRAAGDADLAAGVLRDMAQSLQPRRVGGEGGDEHAAVGVLDHLVQPLPHAELGAGRRLLEDVGRIADQREHAVVADRAQFRLGARGRRAAACRPASSRRYGRSGRRAFRSAAHCPRGSNGRAGCSGSRTGRAGSRPRISTMLSSTCPVSPSSSSLPAIRPAVNGVA